MNAIGFIQAASKLFRSLLRQNPRHVDHTCKWQIWCYTHTLTCLGSQDKLLLSAENDGAKTGRPVSKSPSSLSRRKKNSCPFLSTTLPSLLVGIGGLQTVETPFLGLFSGHPHNLRLDFRMDNFYGPTPDRMRAHSDFNTQEMSRGSHGNKTPNPHKYEPR